MDIFAVRQLVGSSVENLVVELKHPEITLGEKELGQVKKYLDVVASEPRFNDTSAVWRFYLVGNDYNRQIEREIESHKVHLDPGLVHRFDNFRVYVKKWSEVFNEFKIRHKFISEKLLAERAALSGAVSADKNAIHASLAASAARAPAEMTVEKVKVRSSAPSADHSVANGRQILDSSSQRTQGNGSSDGKT